MHGKRIWHFQSVRHDICWDRDFPISSRIGERAPLAAKMVDAVAQTTKKSGFVYLFDRATGEPLFPIRGPEVSGERRTR